MEVQSEPRKTPPAVTSVPRAGELIFGWKASQSYAHASEAFGDSLIRIGRRLFVRVAPLVERFGVDPDALTETTGSES